MTRVVDEGWLNINTGIGTEGVMMTFAVFMLLSHPSRLPFLQTELGDLELHLGHWPGFQELCDLSYLTAVIQESFRFNHRVSRRLARYNNHNDMTYGGKLIPKGVSVPILLYDSYINPDVLEDPYAFKPKRWLDSEERKRLRKYVNHFGRGPRACIDKGIANIEVYLALRRLFAPSVGFNMELIESLFEHDVASYYNLIGAPPKNSNNIRLRL